MGRRGRPDARDCGADRMTSLPAELVVVWLLYTAAAAAMFVTYSRVPVHELYHVSHGGLAGGASRVLVFSNFSAALVAIAMLALLAGPMPDRLSARAARR